jgi:ATP-dependent Clp protease ATP-binding subunit ClpC
MSQGYTEGAKRIVFSARAQAMHYGSAHIESEHILLAILDESQGQASQLFGEGISVELLRREIEKNLAIHESISGSVEVPLTAEAKRILNVAFEEADELRHEHVGFEHLLLGILQVESCMAAKILFKHGSTIAAMRKEAIRNAQNPQ